MNGYRWIQYSMIFQSILRLARVLLVADLEQELATVLIDININFCPSRGRIKYCKYMFVHSLNSLKLRRQGVRATRWSLGRSVLCQSQKGDKHHSEYKYEEYSTGPSGYYKHGCLRDSQGMVPKWRFNWVVPILILFVSTVFVLFWLLTGAFNHLVTTVGAIIFGSQLVMLLVRNWGMPSRRLWLPEWCGFLAAMAKPFHLCSEDDNIYLKLFWNVSM